MKWLSIRHAFDLPSSQQIQELFASMPKIIYHQSLINTTNQNNNITKITDNLYLGSVEGTLEPNGFNCILSIGHPPYYQSENNNNTIYIEFENLPDSKHSPLSAYFPVILEIVKTIIARNGTVFCHCHQGRSRSPAIMVMLVRCLQICEGNDLLSAYSFVKHKHQKTLINPAFLKQLRQYFQEDLDT
jgi:hypothetical protein